MEGNVRHAVWINVLELLFLISTALGEVNNQDTMKVNLRNAAVPGGITLNFNQPFRDVILNTVEETNHKTTCNGGKEDVQKSEPSDNSAESENGNGNSKTERIIAFHATLTAGDLGPNYEERLVKFNNVDLNLGKAYDSESGKFTAPETGVYKFTVNALQKDKYQIFLSVKRQGKDYAELHSSGVRYDSHSLTVLMQLDKGQMTWVELPPSSVYAVYGKGRYTSFCGYLVASL